MPGGDGGLSSGKSIPSGNSASLSYSNAIGNQAQSQTRQMVINPNWRKNIGENHPRYSEDFSAARALSQGGYINMQQA